jgi:hypothetical protein
VFQDCSNSHVILPSRAAGALVTPEDRTCEPAAEANERKSAPKTAGLQLRSARRPAYLRTHRDRNIRTRTSCGRTGKIEDSPDASAGITNQGRQTATINGLHFRKMAAVSASQSLYFASQQTRDGQTA